MTDYRELPEELTKTRNEAAVSPLVDLQVHTATDVEVEGITSEQAQVMYKTMWNIRNFEENARRFFAAGQIPGFVHLYAGEEAIATGVCANLTDRDYITSTHRGHGHCVAKGGDLKGMMAESTPQWYSSGSGTIAERAAAYNMPGVRVNGKDIIAVYEVTKDAVQRARNGEGPTLIEAVTYRNYGHFEGDEQKYKAPDGEEKAWADVDPMKVFYDYAIEHELLTAEELDQLAKESEEAVKEAIEFAQNSPIPAPESLLEDVFAD